MVAMSVFLLLRVKLSLETTESVSVSVVTFSVHSVILSILNMSSTSIFNSQITNLFRDGDGDTSGEGGRGPNLNGDVGGDC